MSPKLPVNNSQTITEFFNLHKEDIHEETTEESYKFAFADEAFLARKETMGIRFELELLKPDILLREHGIEHTITVFGSTRFISHDEAEKRVAEAKTPEEQFEAKRAIDNSHFYEEARKFGTLVAQYNATQTSANNKLHICTGGGPGIMEAASRGAFESGDQTIGFNISLPREQRPNPYLTEGLSFRFHYFALRKMHFMLRARAIVAFPGGFGSMDELFEVLTLMQTHKVAQLPIILVGKSFWESTVNFDLMMEYGVIERSDMKLLHFTETAEETWQIIQQWYQLA
ncbi:LOG family protein [Polynucleobacter sp. MWH-P3-07-1]|uniref:LOG family protein n=1 Tax=Polynucleobacter sp. MWH-P3-07-1 TaxID=1743173 RepID=UPI001BFD0423|nr:LOG family protein [Polynucleobacter sp. MWH-P3-07-1]QWD84147.1 LOG family protein [Polynucleobacter sp. MWH-P3-07-1]